MASTIQTVQVLVQVGEVALPLVEAAITDVVAFAQAHGGNAAVIAQLTADATTIAADKQELQQEAADADMAAKIASSPIPVVPETGTMLP